MKKEWNKNIVRAGLILSFLAINALILFGISSVFSYLNTGADRADMLHLESPMAEVYLPKMEWAQTKSYGRPMEEQTLQKIQKDYLSAWHVRNQAFMNNEQQGISDYYTDSTQQKIYRIIDLNKANGTSVKGTTLDHHPTLEFYSADGKLVVFTDRNVVSFNQVFKDQTLVSQQSSSSSFKVMMLLEDGFWRIRHMVEIQEPIDDISEIEATTKEKILEISMSKGVNYYPKDSPWAMFGDNFKEEIVDKDFDILQKMGLNTVRIFVPYEDFGIAKVDEQKLAKLKRTLDKAGAHELKVIVTLFDFYGDYDIRDWTFTHRHAEQIVTALKDHEALLAWDIKNEPDLDFESRGKEVVLAWLEQLVLIVKQWDKNHPVTIGWSNPEVAVQLSEEVDFVSFHYYKELSQFKAAIDMLQSSIPDKVLVLQEYGYSSYYGIWNGYQGDQKDQADYYKQIQTILDKEHIPFLFWTMYDFEEVPTSVVGSLPWRRERQKYFGFLDSEGEAKPSFRFLDYSKKIY
ncbi:glycosyl hydrolase family 5 [Sediminicola sp. YIK13]|uniref:cellulase family glycosylhydrolase n=1 Tax=Sediminicola sp. YIK13 TaxID=1453352 RepID=UPI00072076B4|nr:cellulase family glycosylhydrolase [Sediminicola sp. YIK13]ALM07466.1 glycosyl hydrolase family 5 [Sediminicola sp. YIK13]